MDSKDIKVSVLCLAYNHRNYIEKSLDSIIAQETDFAFEIVVHDDKSTDGTTEIIRQYEKRYPNLVKPVYEDDNQYSQGIDVIDASMPHIKGHYMAFCEGDDYWMDISKLQRQYEIMEAHPEIDMCACGTSEILANNGIEINENRPRQKNCIFTTEEVLEKIILEGRCFAAASLFFRKHLLDSLMEFEKVLRFDLTYQMKGALRGGIYYIDRKMAAYRKWAEGSWTTRYKKDRKMQLAHLKKEEDMLQEFDRETGGKFHSIIERRLSCSHSPFEQLMMHREEVKTEISNLLKSQDISYLWGLGMRGYAFQEFCKQEGINLNGVCDMQDINIGQVTEYGYQIAASDYVQHNSNVIFASNDTIYNYLVEKKYPGRLVNLQKYM